MKKILLTTSALTLLAGAAAADVNLSGYGRIGISTTGGNVFTVHKNELRLLWLINN